MCLSECCRYTNHNSQMVHTGRTGRTKSSNTKRGVHNKRNYHQAGNDTGPIGLCPCAFHAYVNFTFSKQKSYGMFSGLSPPIQRNFAPGLGDCPTTPDEWDHILDKSLSGSDFDLYVHHKNDGYGDENAHDLPTEV